ncbi:MAG: helix-turn-helix transcriptional regulator [Crocinitomicaceae bacterium]|nr:helix-turn-helix transcriptional regulator [Crocinitomicaceae bacterium]
MADKLEMSVSGYSKLERGDVELTVNKLFKIAELLEVSVSQILNFDASQIFNVSNNHVVNGVDVKEQHNHYVDEYKDKYIHLLEAEVARLKKSEEK